MKRLSTMIAAVSLAAVTFAGSLSAQSSPGDLPRVRDGIVYVGMAYEISEKCGAIRARTLRGIGFLQDLKAHAISQGFTDAQIDEYVDDKDEQRRLEALARGLLADLGVVEGDESTYCAVGRSQMDANTRVGWLLR
ncbi:DUF5333 domain-containing protein [Yoonia sp. 2307UL14-13]|uniref:DUF5333 domain-containing protein n=1 Tax=Yoonia sp. 2307UL14-13 TaxID=3126506 RepID=UPI0030A70EAD